MFVNCQWLYTIIIVAILIMLILKNESPWCYSSSSFTSYAAGCQRAHSKPILSTRNPSSSAIYVLLNLLLADGSSLFLNLFDDLIVSEIIARSFLCFQTPCAQCHLFIACNTCLLSYRLLSPSLLVIRCLLRSQSSLN